MNLEKAIRNKYRFVSPNGLLSLEDLWDLPLLSSKANRADLDGVAREISRELKTQTEDSFVTPRADGKKTELEEKLAIVVHIISVLQAENAAAVSAQQRKQQKAQLTEILHIRTQQDLMSKTPAEIEAMIADLDKPQ